MKHALHREQKLDATDYARAAAIDCHAITEICAGNVDVTIAAHRAIAVLLELQQAIDVQPVIEEERPT
jgi:hypothetical protein